MAVKQEHGFRDRIGGSPKGLSVKRLFRNAAHQWRPSEQFSEFLSRLFLSIYENGIFKKVRIQGQSGEGLSVEDFEFQVSPQGAFDAGANPPANWQSAPAASSITVTPGSPDRVLIQWPDQSIMNRWLRITVLATEETKLAEPEVYYIGHLLGETTEPENEVFTVSFADITPIRREVGQTVDASSIADIDKNGTVSFADISAMRGNVGAQLRQIIVP